MIWRIGCVIDNKNRISREMREYRFDVVRVICMTYIISCFHLFGYIYPQDRTTVCFPVLTALAHTCLGLFTFVSGYLLGKKYCFGQQGNIGIWSFYKKRILRVFPLFVIASMILWLIGFNDADSTWNGLLCISPFVNPKPMTLYFIPVIMWCYLVTPLISRRGLKWRALGCLFLFSLLLVGRFLFPSIDSRFVFDVFFFFVGVVSAPCFDWKLNNTYGTTIKIFVVLAFALVIAIAVKSSLLYNTSRQMAVGAIGVFAVFFICEGVSNYVFGRKKQLGQLFIYVSYASMACYMFHRFFYRVAESLWNPFDTNLKWLYMAGLVFPVMIVLSYVIQNVYDNIVKKI